MNWTWIDWLLIAFILISGVISLWRGFIKECLSVVIWLLSIVIAWLYADSLAFTLDGVIDSYAARFAISAVALSVGVLLTGAIIQMILGKLISFTGFSSTDRLIGVIFGLCRGIMIITIIVGVLEHLPIHRTSWWQRSVLMPKFEYLAVWSKGVVTDKIQPLISHGTNKQPVSEIR